jgi:hypothetical protein
MEIGLKWENVDSDPGAFLSLRNGKQPVDFAYSNAPSGPSANNVTAVSAASVQPAVQPKEPASIMADWSIDPVSMFEKDVPMSKSKSMLVPA